MTTRIFPKFRPRRRMPTRKLALELWAVGLASAILLAIAVVLNGAADSKDIGAAVEGGRLAQPMNPELKDFMERAAHASAASLWPIAPASDSSPSRGLATAPMSVPALLRAAVAPRAAEPKAHAARVARSIPPPPRPALAAGARPTQTPVQQMAMLEGGPWRLVKDTGASAVANLVSVGNSLTSLAKKLPL